MTREGKGREGKGREGKGRNGEERGGTGKELETETVLANRHSGL